MRYTLHLSVSKRVQTYLILPLPLASVDVQMLGKLAHHLLTRATKESLIAKTFNIRLHIDMCMTQFMATSIHASQVWSEQKIHHLLRSCISAILSSFRVSNRSRSASSAPVFSPGVYWFSSRMGRERNNTKYRSGVFGVHLFTLQSLARQESPSICSTSVGLQQHHRNFEQCYTR